MPMDTAKPKRFPIREVSKKTGVNSVTLRAWERRYGLVRPQRTPKGHRLYSLEDIQLIHNIVSWLKRGVSVSQVGTLLENQPIQRPTTDNNWSEHIFHFLSTVQYFSTSKLDSIINPLLALHALSDVMEHLVLPVHQTLNNCSEERFGRRVEAAFYSTYITAKLTGRFAQANAHSDGTPIIIATLNESDDDIGLLAMAVSAVAADCNVCLITHPTPLRELVIAGERTATQGYLLYASKAHAIDDIALRHLVNHSAKPVAIAGHAALIRKQQLLDTGVTPITLGPVQAGASFKELL